MGNINLAAILIHIPHCYPWKAAYTTRVHQFYLCPWRQDWLASYLPNYLSITIRQKQNDHKKHQEDTRDTRRREVLEFKKSKELLWCFWCPKLVFLVVGR